MNKNQYNQMKLKTIYNATINGKAIKVRKPDSGGIADYDEPTREYQYEDITLISEINQ